MTHHFVSLIHQYMTAQTHLPWPEKKKTEHVMQFGIISIEWIQFLDSLGCQGHYLGGARGGGVLCVFFVAESETLTCTTATITVPISATNPKSLCILRSQWMWWFYRFIFAWNIMTFWGLVLFLQGLGLSVYLVSGELYCL